MTHHIKLKPVEPTKYRFLEAAVVLLTSGYRTGHQSLQMSCIEIFMTLKAAQKRATLVHNAS
ncbi:hypothetical protein SCY69_04145 [Xanthomonas euvesicatoria]|uniref:hypothetical protein n=1 Tax=Xanthomonas euvesicatoria TaxID=456327 RepID=UPI001E5CA268|nr:hypothetical protein [Xanthomonas euvesicatoria]MDW7717867.1 hypothetical protein [Xanthomonas euvesicatoria]MDW7778190.1 hypothetical protein [Xanthomonas euvesicatoria]